MRRISGSSSSSDAELRLRLGRGVIISVLVIDLGDVELGPADFLHLEPGAIGLQPPVEHPLGLVLLGRDEADRVFVEALGREFLLDVGDEAPFVILRDLLLELAVLDGLVHRASSVRLHCAERAAHRVADDAHVRLDPAMRVERAVGAALRADRHRDRAFDRLDDVGEADFGCAASQAQSRRWRRARSSAGRRRRAGPSASAWWEAGRRSRPKARSR